MYAISPFDLLEVWLAGLLWLSPAIRQLVAASPVRNLHLSQTGTLFESAGGCWKVWLRLIGLLELQHSQKCPAEQGQ